MNNEPIINPSDYFQEWDPQTPGLAVCTRSESEVRAWCEEVAAQRILLTTPSLLLGERLSVYRVEGTTQWYSAFIIGINQETGVRYNVVSYLVKRIRNKDSTPQQSIDAFRELYNFSIFDEFKVH